MSLYCAAYGAALPPSPVLISVPHAGRIYPDALLDAARLSADQLRPLEDRYADLLARAAQAAGHELIIQPVARAWMDLNRAVDELDPAEVAHPHGSLRFRTSTKVRGGLGLIPTRIHPHGAVWKAPLAANDIEARISAHHAPWHAAIEAALEARLRHFGTAILIDLHSMPPIRDWRRGGPCPRLVIGDLHGASAGDALVTLAHRELAQSGLPVARNHPYAGGYCLSRHGKPARGIHALQIEVDRSIYLDAAMQEPGAGLRTLQQLIARLANSLAAAVLPDAIAAE